MPVTSEAVAGVFGLVIGSFIGVVVDRLPRQESIVSPPSHCVACSAPIRAYDNIPVVSYVVLTGPVPGLWRAHPTPGRVLGARDGDPVRAARLAVGLAVGTARVLRARRPQLVAISAIDVEHMRIPTADRVRDRRARRARCSSSPRPARTAGPALLSAAIGGAAAFAAFFTLFFAVPKGIGFGDVRLAGLCGGFLGWIGYREVVAGFLLSFIVAGVPAALLLAMRKVQAAHADPLRPVPRRRHCDHRAVRGADHPRLV